MSRSSILPIHQAVLDAHAAARAIVPSDLHRAVILIGGAAALYRGVPGANTQDADIACSPQAMVLLVEAAENRRGGFRRDPDGEVKWEHTRLGFLVKVDFLLMPGECMPWRRGRRKTKITYVLMLILNIICDASKIALFATEMKTAYVHIWLDKAAVWGLGHNTACPHGCASEPRSS